jgi:hypothetical protein
MSGIRSNIQTPWSDMEAVPGVDKALIEAMKPRLLFDRSPEDQ